MFAFPREGFGTSVIEATAMKVSDISNIYGLNEIVNKNNGYLLDSIDKRKLKLK